MDLSSLWLIVICGTFGFAWWLSRRDIQISLKQKNELPKQYFIGLKHLLNEQPDLAIDAFIQVAKLDPTSIELHLSLGQMFRRQGEFSRAIRLNTYLSQRTDISPHHQKQVLWHLAQDYYKAGIYDRAENVLKPLLQNILNEEPKNIAYDKTQHEFKKQILDILLKIANWEQDWQKASEYLPFLPQHDEAEKKNLHVISTHILLNQYENEFIRLSKKYNEAANIESLKLTTGTLKKPLESLSHKIQSLKNMPQNQGSHINQHHPRASLLLANIALLQEKPEQTLEICQNLLRQNSHLHYQIMQLIEKTSHPLQQQFWLKYFSHYFEYDENQRPTIIAPLTESVVQILTQQPFTTFIAEFKYHDFISACLNQLKNNGSVFTAQSQIKTAILNAYLEMQKKRLQLNNQHSIEIDDYIIPQLQQLTKQQKTNYICDSCGFLAKNFSWSCPGCREWDTLQAH